MKFDRPFFSIIIFAFCLIFPAISFGQVNRTERIISYNSDININQDGSMIVTETITVHSEGINIKRGIYRDFPTDYKDNYGNNIKVDFDLLETLRDGNTEDYHTENLSNGIRVYLGNKNVYLRPGNYTYKIVYKTNRQLGFFGDHDELYWNVTGNGWDFPIEKASAVVSLPEGIASSQIKCYGYTGLQGSRASNLKCSVIGPGKVRYFTTELLRPRQGLTIVAEFPKGFVAEPTKAEKMGYFIKDNSGIIIGLIGVIVVFLYYFFIWLKVGKDPEKGTIIPLFTPPSKFSPSAMRYVKKMGFDNKNFAAAIINMAVKGYLKIEEIDGDYTLIRKNSDLTNLTTEEKKIASSLTFSKNGSAGFNEEQAEEIQKKLNTFGNKNFFFKKITGAINSSLQQKLNQNKNKTADDGIYKLELKQSNHTIIKSGIDALKKSLKNSYEKNYFLTNRKYFVIGLIISLLFLVASTLLSSAVQTGLLIWVSVWSVGVFALLFTAFKSWRDVFKGG